VPPRQSLISHVVNWAVLRLLLVRIEENLVAFLLVSPLVKHPGTAAQTLGVTLFFVLNWGLTFQILRNGGFGTSGFGHLFVTQFRPALRFKNLNFLRQADLVPLQ